MRQAELVADLVRVGHGLPSHAAGGAAAAAGHVDRNAIRDDPVVDPGHTRVRGLVERDQRGDLRQQRPPVRRAAARATARVVDRRVGDEGAGGAHVRRARDRVGRHGPAGLGLAGGERRCGQHDVAAARRVRAVVADGDEGRVQRLLQVHVGLHRAARHVAGAGRERPAHVDGETQQPAHEVGGHDEVQCHVDVAAFGRVAGEAVFGGDRPVLRREVANRSPHAAHTPFDAQRAGHTGELAVVEGRVLAAAQVAAHPRGLGGDQAQAVVGATVGRVGEVLVGAVVLHGLRDLHALHLQVRPLLEHQVDLARHLRRLAAAERGDAHAHLHRAGEIGGGEVPAAAERCRVLCSDHAIVGEVYQFDTHPVGGAVVPADAQRLTRLQRALAGAVAAHVETQDLGRRAFETLLHATGRPQFEKTPAQRDRPRWQLDRQAAARALRHHDRDALVAPRLDLPLGWRGSSALGAERDAAGAVAEATTDDQDFFTGAGAWWPHFAHAPAANVAPLFDRFAQAVGEVLVETGCATARCVARVAGRLGVGRAALAAQHFEQVARVGLRGRVAEQRFQRRGMHRPECCEATELFEQQGHVAFGNRFVTTSQMQRGHE